MGREDEFEQNIFCTPWYSSRKLARLLANICACSLFDPVVHMISSKSCDRVPNLTCFVLSLVVTRVAPQIVCNSTLASGDVLLVAGDAAYKSGTKTAPDGMYNVWGLS
eukprot:9137436-Ditylum_brightwellii.AAC.1